MRSAPSLCWFLLLLLQLLGTGCQLIVEFDEEALGQAGSGGAAAAAGFAGAGAAGGVGGAGGVAGAAGAAGLGGAALAGAPPTSQD